MIAIGGEDRGVVLVYNTNDKERSSSHVERVATSAFHVNLLNLSRTPYTEEVHARAS